MLKVAPFLLFSALVWAEGPSAIELPKPQTEGGKPLRQALKERKSVRDFRDAKLPLQVLSNLLWAADGINRPDGRRTAPSAHNRQSVDVYVATADGTYLYNAKSHALEPIAGEDLRAASGTQDYVAKAAVNLIYVADFAKMGDSPETDKLLFAGAEVGFISQNVYLYCAAEGLATVVRGSMDRQALAKRLKLRPAQRLLLAQSVGYPK